MDIIKTIFSDLYPILRGCLLFVIVLLKMNVSNAQEIVKKEIEDSGKIIVYPNPLTESNLINIEFELPIKGKLTYILIDQIGNPYLRKEKTVESEINNFSIDCSSFGLKPGIYFLRIKNNSKPEKVLKIIKK